MNVRAFRSKLNFLFCLILRSVTRFYPLNSPRASLLRLLPDVPEQFGLFSAKHRLSFADWGAGSDHVAKSLFWFGDFDPWVGQTLSHLVGPDDIVCDIGANIGATALPLARAIGPSGRIYCFEPVNATAQRLSRNIEANGLQNAEVFELALSDQDGTSKIGYDKNQPGMASVNQSDQSTTVLSRRFDAWVEDLNIASIAVCKIDVEGHEPAVVRGMKASLQRGIISSLVFESHGDRADEEVISSLREYGYKIYRIYKGIYRVYYVSLDGQGKGVPTSDYVAVKSRSVAERRLDSVH
jgi:FkbM family methyltransferase